MNKEKIAIIFLGIIVITSLALRFFLPADKWVCENGSWVNHGNPLATPPEEVCGEVAVTVKDEEEQLFILEGQDQEQVIVDSIKNNAVPTLSQPNTEELISSPLIVKGEAPGYWFFEANLPIKLLDESGNLIVVAPANATSDWMTEDFVPFESLLEFQTTATSGYLVIENDNPSGLPENSKMISFPVKFLNN